MVDERYREDFKQELFIIILEDKTGSVVDAYEAGKILFYTVRTIINLVYQKRNIFHKKYITHSKITKEFTDKDIYCQPCEGFEVRKLIENKEVKVLAELKNLDARFGTFYYRMLVELVKTSGSMREASRRTGIPVSTISRGIAVVRKHIKKTIK